LKPAQAGVARDDYPLGDYPRGLHTPEAAVMLDAQSVENVLQSLTAGVLIGAIYGLMCTGLALIFGVMRVINFAQGDFMMLGMYAAWYFFAALGVSVLFGDVYGPYAAAFLAGPVLFIYGFAIHILLVSRVSGAGAAQFDDRAYRVQFTLSLALMLVTVYALVRTISVPSAARTAIPVLAVIGYAVYRMRFSRGGGTRMAPTDGDTHHAQLILTLGIALIVQNAAQIVFGSNVVSVRTPLSSSAWIAGPLWGDEVEIFVNKARCIAAAISVAIIAVMAVVISRTRIGKALRAAADDPTAATYLGIDVDRAHRLAFALGVSITAVAGGLLAPNYPFHPFVGLEYVIIMYAGVVLGGLGSVIGPFWGGMTIGIVQQMSALVLPTQLQNATIFVVFLLIIFLRPQGFFGRVVERT
jgi:branched-chain amino acid transport system permease protein